MTKIFTECAIEFLSGLVTKSWIEKDDGCWAAKMKMGRTKGRSCFDYGVCVCVCVVGWWWGARGWSERLIGPFGLSYLNNNDTYITPYLYIE